MKKILIPVVMLALFNYGCYSFYEISSKDIPSNEEHNDIKLELKNKVDILLKEEGNFNIEVKESMIYFSNETTKDSIRISDINRIYNKKLSVEKILGVGLIIPVGYLFFLLLVACCLHRTGGLNFVELCKLQIDCNLRKLL